MAGKFVFYWSQLVSVDILFYAMVFALLASIDFAHATTYYVSQSTANGWSIGNSNNACTATNAPCLSVSGGLGKMSSGDTLIINDGTYVDQLNDLIPSGGGTEGTRTIIKCLNARKCTLDASSTGLWLTNSDSSWITIQDMVICCENTTLLRFGTTSSLPSTNFPHHIRVQNNDIHSTTGYCIYTGHGQFNEFLNNSIHNCGEQGVYATFQDSTFRGNDVYNVGMASVPNKNQAMQVITSGGMTPTGNLIEGNSFHHGPGDCLLFSVTSGNTVRRNVFYSCAGTGLRVGAGVGDINDSNIDHNTFYGNGNGLIISHTGSTGNKVRNNAAAGNIGTQVSICSGCGTTTTNLTTGTPTTIWTNPTSGNFTLRAGSPAIDVCTSIGLPFSGYAPDCGAFESGGDTTPPQRVSGVTVQ